MTDKERITEALRKQGIPYTETDTTVTFKTDLWIVDYGFDPDGSLDYTAQGNLAAVQKLELYGERSGKEK